MTINMTIKTELPHLHFKSLILAKSKDEINLYRFDNIRYDKKIVLQQKILFGGFDITALSDNSVVRNAPTVLVESYIVT